MSEKIEFDIVNDASECTVKQFMKCAFDNKYDALIIAGVPSEQDLKSAFEFIYAQYVDISGLYLSQEFEILGYIEGLSKRKGVLEEYVKLQNAYFGNFQIPFLPGLPIAEKYGYKIYWDPAYPDTFMQKLNQIPAKESKYKIRIAEKTKELVELRKKKEKKEHSLLESRKSFITTLNRLQQQKFVIDKSTTTVEELALMIKDVRDIQEENKAQNSFKPKR